MRRSPEALQSGTISSEEFVLLNEGVAGYDADMIWRPGRMKADPAVLHTYYSGGLVSDGRQWAKTPIIDLRGDNNVNGDVHANWRAWGQRDRLDRDYGDPDYAGALFTADQQGRLRAVFPDGVCDWSRRGLSQVPVNPWTTFADGPGGVPLSDPPSSKLGHD